jgi:D-alanyl-D-alanine carboxypeptidase
MKMKLSGRCDFWIALIHFVFALSILPTLARADEVDDRVRAQMRWQRIPGLSLMVATDGHLIRAKGYGVANVEESVPATAETAYKIASMSKQFLAAGMLVLVQEGKVHLDDTVDLYIADVPETWKLITIRHLLSHTSGLAKDSDQFDPFKAQTDLEVIRSVYPVPLQFRPGERWSYSNIGYYIVGEIIHHVSKRSWGEFISEKVFAPAGMFETRLADPVEIVPHRASGYEVKMGKLQNAEIWRAVRPSGAFLTTVLDLAKWDSALYSNDVLGASNRELMWTPIKVADEKSHGYGLGWFVDNINGHRRVHHEGGVPGFSADFERFPEDKLSVAVLANIGQRDLRDLALAIGGIYLPEIAPAAEKEIPDTEPKVTERIKRIISDLANGELDKSQLSGELAGWLAGDLKQGFADVLRSLGPIQSMLLLERSEKDRELSYRYQLSYQGLNLTARCVINEAGKIKRLSIQD